MSTADNILVQCSGQCECPSDLTGRRRSGLKKEELSAEAAGMRYMSHSAIRWIDLLVIYVLLPCLASFYAEYGTIYADLLDFFTRSRTMHLYRTQSGREKQLTADRSQQTVKETTNFSIHLTSCKHPRRFFIKRADLVTNPSIIEMMVNCWVITPFLKTCASLIYLKAEDSWVSQASLK